MTDDVSISTTPAALEGGGEKKKKCCPFGDCRYRMKMTDFIVICRCGGSFCPTHRPAEQHNCSFNYRTAASQTLSTQLSKCVGDRMVDKV